LKKNQTASKNTTLQWIYNIKRYISLKKQNIGGVSEAKTSELILCFSQLALYFVEKTEYRRRFGSKNK
jgi:hypothetical protein